MKKTFLIVVLSLLLSLFCFVACAQDRYEYYGGTANGDKYYIDRQSISYTSNSNVIRYWEKRVFSSSEKKRVIAGEYNEKTKNIFRKVSYMLNCEEIDFGRNMSRIVQTIYYSSTGDVLDIDNTIYGWSYIVPGSMGELARDTVKRILQSNSGNYVPPQPFALPSLPQIQLNTPQQQREYQQFLEYSAWLQSQPDFHEFDRWVAIRLQQYGLTTEQLTTYLADKLRRNGGHYSEIQSTIAGWYREFYMERYGR